MVALNCRGEKADDPVDITIENLASHSHLVPVVAEWFESEWPRYYGSKPAGTARRDLDAYCNVNSLPMGMVALHGAEPCGFAALKPEPFAGHPRLAPWLGAAYVVPSLRRNRIGTRLFHALEAEAARLGYCRLYCATATSGSLLRRSQWRFLHRVPHEGAMVEIHDKDVVAMERSLRGGHSRVALEEMEKNPRDLSFALRAKKEALGPYIAERWGWAEEDQRRNMLERWNRAVPYEIAFDGEAAGIVSIEYSPGAVTIEELYVLPQYQRRGIGGGALRKVLLACAQRSLPVTLQCLKWNVAAIRFYRRHGFVVSHETETHVAMSALV